jgi:RHS repeat-associated protein
VPSYFLYDGGDPVVEEAPDGSLISANMFGLDGPRVQYVPGYNYFYQQNGTNDETVLSTFDPQGSLVQRLSVQTNANYTQFAGVHDTRVYDAFGGLRGMYGTSGQAGTGLSGLYPTFGFGGQYGYYSDRWTGLVLMTHRHYDPSTGRFITRDPIGYKGGIGLYAFCGNNPVTEMDPSGLNPTWDGIVDGCYNASWGAGIIGQTQQAISFAKLWRKYGYVRASKIAAYRQRQALIHSVTDLWSKNPHDKAQAWTGVAITLIAAKAGAGVKAGEPAESAAASTPGTPSIKITGYTKHGLNQAIGRNGGRGVNSAAMLDAIRNPKNVTTQANGLTKVVGRKANVIMNGAGKVVTVTGKARGPQLWLEPNLAKRPQGSGPAQRAANARGFSYLPRSIR